MIDEAAAANSNRVFGVILSLREFSTLRDDP
jgi:hypothetical protein